MISPPLAQDALEPRWILIYAAAIAHPLDQPVPGPEGRVPPDWEDLLNE
jgi:hypothetical protein